MSVVDRLTLKDGRQVTIYAGNIAEIVDPKHHSRMVRHLAEIGMLTHGMIVPDRSLELKALNQRPVPEHPYVDGQVLVVLRPGTTLRSDRLILSPSEVRELHRDPGAKHPAVVATYHYSNDSFVNRALTILGVSYAKRLLTAVGGRVATMRSRASNVASLLPIENTYVMQITNGTAPAAIERLRRIPSVLYAGPNLRVATMNTEPIPMAKAAVTHAIEIARSGHAATSFRRLGAFSVTGSDIPTNYAVAYSAQSALNAPGVNALAAYDEIESHFKQLPGQGEIITDVSLGDVTDSKTFTSPADPCYYYAQYNGYTTNLIGGQNYLEMPSLPMIPAYVADDDGNVSGNGSKSACGQDSSLTEVGLDFSVMAALPDNLQIPSELGSGYSDLLGVAPGALYRLVVPATRGAFLQNIEDGPTNADILGALIGASQQSPAPNVIEMSLGYGFDAYGFPSRYLEEDPILRSAIASVVAQGIVVCISAGDGLRMYTNAPVGPSGGTVAVDTVKSGGTDIYDDEFSTTPSNVIDTGSITVGGTTLDDVTSAPPYQAQYAQYRDQLAFPETRWNGQGSFASAFGTRDNISAPSDNIMADNLYGVGIEGGTSAAAPMVAAGAAVALQVSRLTRKPLSPQEVRSFLVSTARQVPNVPQADVSVLVGPQLNVGNEVETLLRKAGVPFKPAVKRIAIAQRYARQGDFVFTSDTDPSEIDLSDRFADFPAQVGSTEYEPITIAPDWEELPAGTRFRLYVTGAPQKVLGTGPWTRLYPRELLVAGGQPFYSPRPRTVELTYEAYVGNRSLAQSSVSLTFSPDTQDLEGVGPAPAVPPVVTGETIPVQYDISYEAPSAVHDPMLIVSYPGRLSTWGAGDPAYKAAYSVPLTQQKGTIQVPVSALQGNGIYGIAVQINTFGNLVAGCAGLFCNNPVATTFAYTRVATTKAQRPAAPILTYEGDATFPVESGHAIDVSYNQPFQASWSAGNVRGASGAELEISAAGPTIWGNYNMFNNPNGSKVDNDGVDNGSIFTEPLPGVSGTTIVNPWIFLNASQNYTVRVLATNGGSVVGEAGDVSTIRSHGVIPSDGGNLIGGFAVNPTTTHDGVLTSTQLDANDYVDSSLQVFSQTNQLVQATVGSQSMPNGTSGMGYSGNGYPVDVYYINGMGIDASDTAFVGLDQVIWPLYDGAGYFPETTTISKIANLSQQTGCVEGYTCNLGLPLTDSGAPLSALSVSPAGPDYVYTPGSAQSVEPGIIPITSSGLGQAIAPPPAPPNTSGLYPPCTDIAVNGQEAGITVDNNGSAAVQLVNLTTGNLDATVTLPVPYGPLCTLASPDVGVQAWGMTANGIGGVSQLYSFRTPTASLPTSLLALVPLYGGYLPAAFATMLTQHAVGFVIVNAIPPNYTTNANGLSTLEIVTGSDAGTAMSGSGLPFHGWTPFGNYTNILLPSNNNYVAAGPGGLLYLLGPGGSEVSPFLTGL